MYTKEKEEEQFEKVMEKFDQKQPFLLPNLGKYTAYVKKLGGMRLKNLLLKETQDRYNAEKTLYKHGFIQNRKGRWITPDELRRALDAGCDSKSDKDDVSET